MVTERERAERSQAERSQADRILDAALHLPVGIMLDARGRADELTVKGREHVSAQLALARVVGQFAVSIGTKELSKRLGKLIGDVMAPNSSSPGEPASAASTPRAPARPAAEPEPARTSVARGRRETSTSARRRAPVKAETSSDKKDPRRPSRLPIDSYDTLAASQIIARLDALSAAELKAVGRYEAGHRNRKTILGRIAQLAER